MSSGSSRRVLFLSIGVGAIAAIVMSAAVYSRSQESGSPSEEETVVSRIDKMVLTGTVISFDLDPDVDLIGNVTHFKFVYRSDDNRLVTSQNFAVDTTLLLVNLIPGQNFELFEVDDGRKTHYEFRPPSPFRPAPSVSDPAAPVLELEAPLVDE